MVPTGAWFPHTLNQTPTAVLADVGEYDRGDGVKVLLTRDHCHILIRTEDSESSILIPIDEILAALGDLHTTMGN